MNAALVKLAPEKIPYAHLLVNLISRRVRQLNAGARGSSRPLVLEVGQLDAADIALREIIEKKMDFALPEIVPLTRATPQNRRRPQGWACSRL